MDRIFASNRLSLAAIVALTAHLGLFAIAVG
jgi:hypothetical protein